jgi:hypothetical protein
MRNIDRLLLAVCGALLFSGPLMALQEWIHHEDQVGLVALGQPAPLQPAFRDPWRAGLLVAVIAAGVLGTLVALRVARQPKFRAVSARLLTLLLLGMTILDLAFLADGRWFIGGPYALRAATIVWFYPVAAILMGGSLMRLSELESVFGDDGAR